jgi:hypothetical protein
LANAYVRKLPIINNLYDAGPLNMSGQAYAVSQFLNALLAFLQIMNNTSCPQGSPLLRSFRPMGLLELRSGPAASGEKRFGK